MARFGLSGQYDDVYVYIHNEHHFVSLLQEQCSFLKLQDVPCHGIVR